MGIFDKYFGKKIDEPIFVKEYDRESNIQLNQLNDLLEKVGDDQKKLVEVEIKKIQYGLIGEKNVAYELRNSFLPIVCLHDIRLEYKDFSAQFDFIVITQKCIIVLETKALVNDIIIDQYGNFIRVFKDYKGNVYKKEGMNSPISQNEKHVNILRRFLQESKFKKDVPIASVIIMANPKSIIDMKYASKGVKSMMVKHDQIKSKITEICNRCNTFVFNDKTMLQLAEYINEKDSHIEYDFVKMLGLKIEAKEVVKEESQIDEGEDTIAKDKSLDDSLYESLRAFRLQKSKDNRIEAYYIFNNEQLSNLVLNRPTSKEDFIALPGFGEKKYDDYGKDIINIIVGLTKGNIEIAQDTAEEVKAQKEEVKNTGLYEDLKQYRSVQSRQENIKPYFIFNNEQLDTLCQEKPFTKEALIALNGFGEKKYDKYGKEIIEIIKRYVI